MNVDPNEIDGMLKNMVTTQNATALYNRIRHYGQSHVGITNVGMALCEVFLARLKERPDGDGNKVLEGMVRNEKDGGCKAFGNPKARTIATVFNFEGFDEKWL